MHIQYGDVLKIEKNNTSSAGDIPPAGAATWLAIPYGVHAANLAKILIHGYEVWQRGKWAGIK